MDNLDWINRTSEVQIGKHSTNETQFCLKEYGSQLARGRNVDSIEELVSDGGENC